MARNADLRLGMVFLLALAAGCTASRQAPVVDRSPQARPATPAPSVSRRAPGAPDTRPAYHVVKKGDTLYSIALDYGLDYRELAEWNHIDPARIQVGQQLRLTPPAAAATAAVAVAPLKTVPGAITARPLDETASAAVGVSIKSEPKAVRAPYSDQTYAQLAAVKPEAGPAPVPEAKPENRPAPVRGEDELDWMWPANGKIIGYFSESGNSKGIAIAGKLGQPVVASAAGKVIFSGTGIRGFGKLIVIKHNNAFLSVYAHNSQLLVKEGQTVARGQKIAEMGDSDADQVKLHFEIRRFGKPVDPIKLLPDRST